MPSKSWPSASRSHWSRPHGADPAICSAARRTAWSGTQLPAAEQLHRRQVLDRALVGHVEAGEAVHLVAPQVDADRVVGGGREDVDDAAPHRQLAAVLHQRLAPVAPAHQLGDQVVDHHAVAVGHHHRPGRRPPRTQALEDGLHRGHHHVRTLVRRAAPQLPEQPEPVAHGGHVGADPLEGQGLPGREDVDGGPARRGPGAAAGAAHGPAGRGLHQGTEVVGQLVGGGGRGRDHQHRAAAPQADEAGQDEGLGGGGHGQGGVGRADDPREGGLVAKQRGERAEAHAIRVPVGPVPASGPTWGRGRRGGPPGRARAGRVSGGGAPSGSG